MSKLGFGLAFGLILSVASPVVLCQAQANGSSNPEAALKSELESYYQFAKSAASAGIHQREEQERRIRSIPGLGSVDAPRIVFDFIARKQLELSKAGQVPYVGTTELPDLKSIGLPSQWVNLMESSIGAVLKERSSKLARFLSYFNPGLGKARQISDAMDPVASSLAYGVSKNPSSFTEEDKRRLRDIFFEVYRDYGPNSDYSDLYRITPGSYLQYGAWLGDRRAFNVAKKIVDDFLKDPAEEKVGNFQAAAFALEGFESKDYNLSAESRGLLRQIVSSPKTPSLIRTKLADSEKLRSNGAASVGAPGGSTAAGAR